MDNTYYLKKLEKDGVYVIIHGAKEDMWGNVIHTFSALWRTNYRMGQRGDEYSESYHLIKGQCFTTNLLAFVYSYAKDNRQVLIGTRVEP